MSTETLNSARDRASENLRNTTSAHQTGERIEQPSRTVTELQAAMERYSFEVDPEKAIMAEYPTAEAYFRAIEDTTAYNNGKPVFNMDPVNVTVAQRQPGDPLGSTSGRDITLYDLSPLTWWHELAHATTKELNRNAGEADMLAYKTQPEETRADWTVFGRTKRAGYYGATDNAHMNPKILQDVGEQTLDYIRGGGHVLDTILGSELQQLIKEMPEPDFKRYKATVRNVLPLTASTANISDFIGAA